MHYSEQSEITFRIVLTANVVSTLSYTDRQFLTHQKGLKKVFVKIIFASHVLHL